MSEVHGRKRSRKLNRHWRAKALPEAEKHLCLTASAQAEAWQDDGKKDRILVARIAFIPVGEDQRRVKRA